MRQISIAFEPPQPKQKEFFMARKRFVAFGGARGGGKSWSVRGKAVRLCVKHAGIRILIIRKTLKDLEDNHILPLQQILRTRSADNIAIYQEQKKVFILKNGSSIRCSYFDSDNDALQYQGQEYDVIFIEEATQFGEFVFNVLKACVRGVNNFPKRIYLTCNPGGKGHAWVKRLFIDRQFLSTENPDDYMFIQSKVFDNQLLVDSDPEYVKMLESLPDNMREAWLNGNWDVFDGQYFPEFNREKHVVEPFKIPENWRRYTTMDYGLDMLAWYDVAVDENSNVYIVNEIYKSGLIVSEAANLINDYEKTNKISPDARFAPPDLWNTQSTTGKSTALMFGEFGVDLVVSNNDRIAGWLAIKELLKDSLQVDGTMSPKLKIFRNCTNLIRTLPQLQFDDKKINDAANEPHEITHAPDSLRYFAIGWTSPARKVESKRKVWRQDQWDDYRNAKTEEERQYIIKKYGEPL